ncbi:MAG: hypothetical protein ACLP50_27180 [Solirubrobacteraceae bacterium]
MPTALAVAAALAFAGCGSGSGPSSAGSSGASDTAKLLAFSECMRSHAVPNFPDPISQLGVSPSRGGALTPLTPATVPGGSFPQWITVSPQGNSVYVVDAGPDAAPIREVSPYSINPLTGDLTPVAPATVAIAGDPLLVTVSPDSRYAYVVTSPSSGTVSPSHTGKPPRTSAAVARYGINPTTGKIKPLFPATVPTPSGAFSLAVTP